MLFSGTKKPPWIFWFFFGWSIFIFLLLKIFFSRNPRYRRKGYCLNPTRMGLKSDLYTYNYKVEKSFERKSKRNYWWLLYFWWGCGTIAFCYHFCLNCKVAFLWPVFLVFIKKETKINRCLRAFSLNTNWKAYQNLCSRLFYMLVSMSDLQLHPHKHTQSWAAPCTENKYKHNNSLCHYGKLLSIIIHRYSINYCNSGKGCANTCMWCVSFQQ